MLAGLMGMRLMIVMFHKTHNVVIMWSRTLWAAGGLQVGAGVSPCRSRLSSPAIGQA